MREIVGSLVVWGYSAISLVVIAAFWAALSATPMDDDPTGGAGTFAPIIALCTAAMWLSESVFARNSKGPRPIPSVLMAGGMLASAYLWMASEAETHPLDPTLATQLVILAIASGIATISIPLMLLGNLRRNSDE